MTGPDPTTPLLQHGVTPEHPFRCATRSPIAITHAVSSCAPLPSREGGKFRESPVGNKFTKGVSPKVARRVPRAFWMSLAGAPSCGASSARVRLCCLEGSADFASQQHTIAPPTFYNCCGDFPKLPTRPAPSRRLLARRPEETICALSGFGFQQVCAISKTVRNTLPHGATGHG